MAIVLDIYHAGKFNISNRLWFNAAEIRSYMKMTSRGRSALFGYWLVGLRCPKTRHDERFISVVVYFCT
jgi:hypothetical protein